MLSSEFEKEVQHKMEELKFTPPGAVWDNIEASLPGKNKRRLVFFWLLLGLLAGGIWYFTKSGHVNNDKQAIVLIAEKAQNKNAETTAKQAIEKTKQMPAGEKPALVNTNDAAGHVTGVTTSMKAKAITAPGKSIDATSKAIGSRQKINSAGVTGNVRKKEIKEQTSNAKTEYEETISDDKLFLSGSILYSTKKAGGKDASVDGKTMQATTGDDGGKATVPTTEMENLSNAKAGDLNGKPGVVSEKTGNMSISVGNAAKPSTEKKKQLTWEFGLHAGAGLSNVKNGLFEKTMYAADPQTNSGGSVGGGVALGAAGNPTPGFSYSAGLYAEKLIAKRWSFNTGLQYNYASNNIQVGSKVDSTISLDFSSTRLESSVYYRGGVSTTYTNNYHLLQLPVFVKYRPLEGWALYLEAGGSFSYLAGTNGLQYNATRNAYISSEDAFNRWLFSGHAGAGVKLAQKTKLPLNLGYRFAYTATSLTKEAFGQQHLSTSLLYLDIRLNK